MQGRERIICDLGLGRRDSGKKGRLAGIGQADEARVCDQLEAQPDRHLDPDLAGIGATRCAIGGCGEMQVAEAAVAAARQHDALAHFRQIGDQRFAVLVINLGADRHFQHDVGATAARAVAAHAVHAGLGLEMLLETIVDQRVETIDADHEHVAAAAAIATVGTAELDELFTAERDGAGTAVARADVDAGLIEELHVSSLAEATCWSNGRGAMERPDETCPARAFG